MTLISSSPWPSAFSQRRLIIAGLVALGLGALGAIFDTQQFLRSYLCAYLFWLGIVLGSIALWMLHNLTGGTWGYVLRRVWEAAGRTLPLLALLFLPIALGVKEIYPWANGDVHDLGDKTAYLNVPFFLARALGYFAIWLTMEFFLHRWSVAYDQNGDLAALGRAQNLSGPGLLACGLTVTFAAIDWIMSLEAEWYSTIFGALVGTGWLLAALAFAIGVATVCYHLPHELAGNAWNDLGNLLFAFVMLWTYMSFSQFLLIWSGNLPEEIPWYLKRIEGGWQWIGLSLAIGYFALPFGVLLSRDVKRDPSRLRLVAFLVVGMSAVHHFWLIAPAFSPAQLSVHWQDLATFVGVGGLWLSFFVRQLEARPALAIPNPHAEVQHA